MYTTLDLHFLSHQHAIGSFLIESSEGPILIESGPYSTFKQLEAALAMHHYSPQDVKHLLLTHIHFDHAGAAWAFAEQGAKVYLHPFGAHHMHNPDKLVASATQIYGDQMDVLWGDMKGIALKQLQTVEHEEVLQIGDRSIKALHTPGHAKHHIAWVMEGVVFTGDVAGVKIDGGPVVPPCPPPDINLEDWFASIEAILAQQPERLVLTHYGDIADPQKHMKDLSAMLVDWSNWVKEKWEQGLSVEEITPLFTKYTEQQLVDKGVGSEGMKRYEAANPSWMSVAGLVRYWKKQAGA